MNSKYLIRDGAVLTLGNRTANLARGDVLIEDGRISEVGEGLSARGAEVVDATDTIVMPGFVDAHRHVWRSLFKNLDAVGDNLTALESPARYLTPEDVYAATLIGLLGALEAGTTTIVDWLDRQDDPAFVEAALQAHADSGARTVFVQTGSAPVGPTGPLSGVAYGHTTPLNSDTGAASESWSTARSAGLRIHAHVGTSSANNAVAATLARQNLLANDVSLVHCTGLEDSDFDAIDGSGASVILTPSHEMAESFGSPPVQKLLDRGIRPGLGIGDDRVTPGDLFAQMRATISVQHATYFDLKLAGKGGLPNLLRTRDVIRYATADGAMAAGLGDVTGSIEPGKQADIIVLRADRPNIAPINDPIGAVVWGMDTSNLDWVFVGGQVLMREGTLTADLGNARSLAVEAQRRVAEAAGPLIGAGGPA